MSKFIRVFGGVSSGSSDYFAEAFDFTDKLFRILGKCHDFCSGKDGIIGSIISRNNERETQMGRFRTAAVYLLVVESADACLYGSFHDQLHRYGRSA